MSSLSLDDFETVHRPRGVPSKVDLLLETLPEDDAEVLRTVLTERIPSGWKYPSRRIEETLAARDIELTFQAIDRWRRKNCRS